MVCKRFETEEIAERIGDENMKSILHDLEEDYDLYYLLHGVPGSDMDMGLYDREDMEECAERVGVKPMAVEHL